VGRHENKKNKKPKSGKLRIIRLSLVGAHLIVIGMQYKDAKIEKIRAYG
jgi:hypothetical protein